MCVNHSNLHNYVSARIDLSDFVSILSSDTIDPNVIGYTSYIDQIGDDELCACTATTVTSTYLQTKTKCNLCRWNRRRNKKKTRRYFVTSAISCKVAHDGHVRILHSLTHSANCQTTFFYIHYCCCCFCKRFSTADWHNFEFIGSGRRMHLHRHQLIYRFIWMVFGLAKRLMAMNSFPIGTSC